VKRTTRKQEEKNSGTGEKSLLKIRWINNCEYELVQRWANSKAKRKFNGSRTRITITKVYQDKYDFTCACTDGSNVKSGTMVVAR
jgi:hypothetical protein